LRFFRFERPNFKVCFAARIIYNAANFNCCFAAKLTNIFLNKAMIFLCVGYLIPYFYNKNPPTKTRSTPK